MCCQPLPSPNPQCPSPSPSPSPSRLSCSQHLLNLHLLSRHSLRLRPPQFPGIKQVNDASAAHFLASSLCFVLVCLFLSYLAVVSWLF